LAISEYTTSSNELINADISFTLSLKIFLTINFDNFKDTCFSVNFMPLWLADKLEILETTSCKLLAKLDVLEV